jgi:hypothetical protein
MSLLLLIVIILLLFGGGGYYVRGRTWGGPAYGNISWVIGVILIIFVFFYLFPAGGPVR